ncbi:MAG: DNA topoisomerase I [Candidatus Woesearchaeota archaeon]|nr:MAG: DNA topoisomerase I [Candidatus Woesearchaeota archaeon]
MTELIITEKPSASKKIAEALADKSPKQEVNKKVNYYRLKHKGKEIIVVCAVGHIYNLIEKNKKGWTYPVFDIEWKPSYEINKSSAFTKPYLETIKKLAKEADSFTIATDYDLEGEVIGLNVLRFACNKKDAKRMKFSTLTKDELVDSYEKAQKHLDWPQAEAGETRHYLDYFYGINLSRALTLAVKNSGKGFKILSSGRVQGPALKIIVDREKEIQAFKPVPYWQLELITKELIAWHVKDKFWNKKEAEDIYKKTKGKKAIISKIEKKQFQQLPPHPFDLTSLQLEAYKTTGTSPKKTLEIAQALYTNGYISYPRTSSQKLPSSINYKKILTDLSNQKNFSHLTEELLKNKSLKPNEGPKEDKAHPAIYPTGIEPSLSDEERKIYSLIVHRFLATFSTPATRETMSILVDVNKEEFVTKGTRTIEKGWHKFYEPFLMLKEEELPKLKEKQELNVKEIKLHEDQTKPPKRYTPASIIKELEKRNLGTKATRAEIVQTLYDRNYAADEQVKATELGIKTIETLQKYSPQILDEELTRDFELDMEEIQDGKKHKEEILKKAQKVLTEILEDFKKKEKQIGAELGQASIETRKQESYVGKCNLCKEGELRITYSKKNKSYFIACDKYPGCKNTFSVPRGALIKPNNKECDSCKFPTIKVIRKGKRPWDICINPECPKKEEWMKQEQNNVYVV